MKYFEIISVEVEPGGAGPDRMWKVYYKAYVKKKWVTSHLWERGRTAEQAESRAMTRFGPKNSS